MRSRSLRRVFAILAATLLVLVVARFAWAFVIVRSLSSTVARSVEIGFGPVGQSDRLGHLVIDHFDLPDWLHRGTFDVAFRPVSEFEIYYFADLRGDLGAELLRFSGLRRVTIIASDHVGPTESEWTLICTRLRTLPRLEELEIGGPDLTQLAIQPLSGHPRLRKLTIARGIFEADDQRLVTATFPRTTVAFP